MIRQQSKDKYLETSILCLILILFKKKTNNQFEKEHLEILNKNVQNLEKTIEEFSDEQREIVKKFRKELENFTSERSLESCLQALNLSMQLANTRERLIESYRQYSRMLEIELRKQIEQKKDI